MQNWVIYDSFFHCFIMATHKKIFFYNVFVCMNVILLPDIYDNNFHIIQVYCSYSSIEQQNYSTIKTYNVLYIATVCDECCVKEKKSDEWETRLYAIKCIFVLTKNGNLDLVCRNLTSDCIFQPFVHNEKIVLFLS